MAVLAIVAASCTPEPKVEDKITLSSGKYIDAGWQAGTYDVVFTTNAAWTAACSGNFFTLSKTSGEAGTAALTLSVTENNADAKRNGTITITAGTATAVIDVNQDPVGETSESKEVTVTYEAQKVSIETSAKPTSVTSGADWVTVEASTDKAANFAVSENETGTLRSASVTIVVGKHTINGIIYQEPISTALKNPSVTYLGDKVYFYTGSGYTTYGQYLLSFESNYGVVNLVINDDPGADGERVLDPTTVPTGTYVVDASGEHADKTFTVSGDYATNFTFNGTAYNVVDGEIVIGTRVGNYEIKASLVDESGKVNIYEYTGELGEIAKDDFACAIYSAPTYSNYSTYFAGNSYIWDIALLFSAAPAADSWNISYADFKIVTDASAAGSAFPTGTFTYEVPENDPELSGNGIQRAKPGTFYISSGNDRTQASLTVNSKPTLTITKGNDGKYTFTLKDNNITVTKTVYDENWNASYIDMGTVDWNPSFTFEMPATQAGLMAKPDEDIVTFSSGPALDNRYIGYYFGDFYEVGGSAFFFGWTDAEGYTVYLSVNSTPYEFEKNFNNRYCSTPIPAATYNFSNEPAVNTLLPTKSRCYLKNNYTGTTFRINGGSITLSDTYIQFNDMTGKDISTGKVCTFKGGFSAACYYVREAPASQQAGMAIDPVDAPAE